MISALFRLLSGAVPLFLLAESILATTLTVTNVNDSGAGSLRDTIATSGSGDTINFNLPLPATITLTTASLNINHNLTIQGPTTSKNSTDLILTIRAMQLWTTMAMA